MTIPEHLDEQAEARRAAIAAHVAAADAADAQRRVAIWQLPVIPNGDIPDAARIPPTLWETLKAEGDTPPLFTIGRRLFVKTNDLRAWLNAKASHGRPGTRRLRKQQQEAARVT